MHALSCCSSPWPCCIHRHPAHTHTDGLDPLAFPLTQRQQQDLFIAAISTHVSRARRFNPAFLGRNNRAELTLTWRDVHAGKLVPLPVVVRLASLQMVGPEGDAGQLAGCAAVAAAEQAMMHVRCTAAIQHTA